MAKDFEKVPPVPKVEQMSIQTFEDGKSVSDIGLSSRVSGTLASAGITTVGALRRIRDMDLRMLSEIDGADLQTIRERAPFECRLDEKVLVPVEGSDPAQWTETDDRGNRTRP